MNSCTENSAVSLAKEIQKILSKEHRKHGFIDLVKYTKIASKRKYTDI